MTLQRPRVKKFGVLLTLESVLGATFPFMTLVFGLVLKSPLKNFLRESSSILEKLIVTAPGLKMCHTMSREQQINQDIIQAAKIVFLNKRILVTKKFFEKKILLKAIKF